VSQKPTTKSKKTRRSPRVETAPMSAVLALQNRVAALEMQLQPKIDDFWVIRQTSRALWCGGAGSVGGWMIPISLQHIDNVVRFSRRCDAERAIDTLRSICIDILKGGWQDAEAVHCSALGMIPIKQAA